MKIKINKNVYDASIERINFVFDEFEKIYLSFSGGKDSSVMMHLVCEIARERRKKITILFIDMEAQYKLTIQHIIEMTKHYSDICEFHHICLPIILRNAVSVYNPRWICWDKKKRSAWVRDLPVESINDCKYFGFFNQGMEFEEFVIEYAKWISNEKKTACFVGIRSDESLNRYRAIKNDKKEMYKQKKYTTRIKNSFVYNIYPIYDWRTKDIWIYNGKFKKSYNKLYDLMQQAGLSIHQQRICQPYGDDQRKGLWLFQIIEPDTWCKVVARVSGANSGKEFVKINGSVSGQIKITKPDDKKWKDFANILLSSMPKKSKEHYENKIFTFLKWYDQRGFPGDIPDENKTGIEDKKSPSWKRICKMLLRNDYWGKTLSFSQTKTGYFYQKYMERKKIEKQKTISNKKIWGEKWF